MPRKSFTSEQIIAKVRQVEVLTRDSLNMAQRKTHEEKTTKGDSFYTVELGK